MVSLDTWHFEPSQPTTEGYIRAMVSLGYLGGALSPVNHRGLYQGYGFTGYLVGALSPVNRIAIGLYQD